MTSRSTLRGRLGHAFGFSRLVTANIRVKAVSEVFVKAGRFLLILVAARSLGPEGFGLYAFAFAFGNILANASDFGLQMFLSREVAKADAPRAAVLGQAIRAKLYLTACVGALLAGAFVFYPRPIEVRVFVVLLTIVAVIHSWNELWNYFFRGIQSLREEAWLNLLNMAVSCGLGILLLLGGKGIVGLAAGLCVGEVLTCAVALGLIRRRAGFGAQPIALKAGVAIREAAPIGVAILLSILYFRINVLFLERMKGDAVVGSYSAAYKILEGFVFLPAVFLAALYPAFAEATRRSLDQTRRVYRNSLRWMAILGGGIVVGSLALAGPGLRILYGTAYSGSATVLRVLSPAMLFIFLNYALTHFLVALGGQKWNAVFAGLCVLVNVALNLVLIPPLGGIGAAISTVATEGTLFGLCLVVVRRRLRLHADSWHAAAGKGA